MRATAWWHELSGAAKFRLYTRLSFQAVIAVLVVVLAISAESVPSVLGIVAGGIAAGFALEAQPAFATVPGVVARPRMLPVAIVMLVALWAISGIVARLATDEATVLSARTVGVSAVFMAIFSVIPFTRHKWWILVVLSVATPLVVFGTPLGAGLQGAAAFLFTGVFAIVLTRLTVWGLGIIDELERTKGVEAQLQVAEERLRFSRDLHDVVGRGFSAHRGEKRTGSGTVTGRRPRSSDRGNGRGQNTGGRIDGADAHPGARLSQYRPARGGGRCAITAVGGGMRTRRGG
ncbi:hypothetical protein [Nocardia sp. NPDC055049]